MELLSTRHIAAWSLKLDDGITDDLEIYERNNAKWITRFFLRLGDCQWRWKASGWVDKPQRPGVQVCCFAGFRSYYYVVILFLGPSPSFIGDHSSSEIISMSGKWESCYRRHCDLLRSALGLPRSWFRWKIYSELDTHEVCPKHPTMCSINCARKIFWSTVGFLFIWVVTNLIVCSWLTHFHWHDFHEPVMKLSLKNGSEEWVLPHPGYGEHPLTDIWCAPSAVELCTCTVVIGGCAKRQK